MKYVPDSTGRFDKRPHYDPAELDELCERVIVTFMEERCGGVLFPISTDVLTKLIERDAHDLDSSVDLSKDGPRVEGVTEFYLGEKPLVKISERLSLHKWLECRFRTTLAHEYGHVLLHGPLYALDSPCQILTSRTSYRSATQSQGMTSTKDWMEWQAWYVAGALLMPISYVEREVRAYCRRYGPTPPISGTTGHARDLTTKIAKAFLVSEEAARIRLQHLRWILS